MVTLQNKNELLDQKYDGIVVPGGGLTPEGTLSPRNYPRINLALELMRDGLAHKIIFTGGKQLFSDVDSSEISEARLLLEYALDNDIFDVDPRDILIAEDSRDTIGNAVDAKVAVLEPNKISRVLVVTSESHVRRCTKIFSHVLGKEFEVEGLPAPERFARIKRATSMWGALTRAYVLYGTEQGDDMTIRQRLEENIPTDGTNSSIIKFRSRSIANLLMHPLSII